MEDLLYNYMNQRFSEVNHDDYDQHLGPVITISRAAGCSARGLVNELSDKLNEKRKGHKWEVISKDILHHSAELLNTNPEKVKSIFELQERTLFEEVIQTFISGDYQLEKKMIKTVIKVIHKFGAEGNKIIVGRAANIICADIPNSLHIRIDAPLDWRIDQVVKCKNCPREEAINSIKTTEKNRRNFRKTIKKDIHEKNNYDLIINQATFSQDEIIDIIIKAIIIKKID
jgi:cytidylate kinase